MTIASIRADHYRIPLPVALSDSTHGTMEAFELVTVRVRDEGGAEGLGYTYTVGAGGGAIHNLISRDLGPTLAGADATRIEAIWQKLWWRCTTSAAAGSRSMPSRRSTPHFGT
jgi:L-alanine-DL-glutamate epimerase-like enolase superfamily enzyme